MDSVIFAIRNASQLSRIFRHCAGVLILMKLGVCWCWCWCSFDQLL